VKRFGRARLLPSRTVRKLLIQQASVGASPSRGPFRVRQGMRPTSDEERLQKLPEYSGASSDSGRDRQCIQILHEGAPRKSTPSCNPTS